MCTSKKSDEFNDEATDYGIYDILTKPAEPERVNEIINKLSEDIDQGTLPQPAVSLTIPEQEMGALGEYIDADLRDAAQVPGQAETSSPAAVAPTATSESLPTDLIEQVARSAVKANVNNRLHETAIKFI